MNDRRYECPEEYAEEAEAHEKAGRLLEAAKTFELASGACRGRMRAMRYQEAADRLYAAHEKKGGAK